MYYLGNGCVKLHNAAPDDIVVTLNTSVFSAKKSLKICHLARLTAISIMGVCLLGWGWGSSSQLLEDC